MIYFHRKTTFSYNKERDGSSGESHLRSQKLLVYKNSGRKRERERERIRRGRRLPLIWMVPLTKSTVKHEQNGMTNGLSNRKSTRQHYSLDRTLKWVTTEMEENLKALALDLPLNWMDQVRFSTSIWSTGRFFFFTPLTPVDPKNRGGKSSLLAALQLRRKE